MRKATGIKRLGFCLCSRPVHADISVLVVHGTADLRRRPLTSWAEDWREPVLLLHRCEVCVTHDLLRAGHACCYESAQKVKAVLLGGFHAVATDSTTGQCMCAHTGIVVPANASPDLWTGESPHTGRTSYMRAKHVCDS